ncbi:MAG: NAD(+) synthase [Elusimicrobiota bacterium]
MIKKISTWILGKVKEAGAKGTITGLSGGLDSAVVALLCKKAVGKNHLCLILPCESSRKDVSDAEHIARKFKLKTKTVNLTPIYRHFLKILPPARKIARGNLKARLRMITLYYFANKLNYIVSGTGNKSEIIMGYFTKYGDGGVDILPIGNILKRDVRKLACLLNVPEKIILKKPSAGLWQGQTDEGEMGITYDKLDSTINRMGKTPGKQSKDTLTVRIIKQMERTKHKSNPPEIFRG